MWYYKIFDVDKRHLGNKGALTCESGESPQDAIRRAVDRLMLDHPHLLTNTTRLLVVPLGTSTGGYTAHEYEPSYSVHTASWGFFIVSPRGEITEEEI